MATAHRRADETGHKESEDLPMAPRAKAAQGQVMLATTPEAIIAEFTALAADIPDVQDDGGLGIAAQILRATTVEELDAAWRRTSGEDLIGHQLQFQALRKNTSDFADGLGMYLVCDIVDLETGEAITFTTGSVSVCAELIKAHSMGAIPGLIAVLVESANPTKAGYKPQHLEIVTQ